MCRFSKYPLLIAALGVLASHLYADPIPTLAATSATAFFTSFTVCPGPNPPGCQTGISASSDSFTLSGGGPTSQGANFVQQGTFSTSFQQTLPAFGPFPPQPGSGQVTIGGVTFRVEYFGTFTVNGPELQSMQFNPAGNPIQVSYGNTVELISPSSPTATFFLPATIQGSFLACNILLLPPFPSGCDASSPAALANISINLPGELTYSVHINFASGTPLTTVDESFASIPEPTSLLLVGFGIALTAGVSLRRKRNT